MKTILLLLLFLPCYIFAQDRIILLNSDTLVVNVVKSSPASVEYTYPGEQVINILPKNTIFKIEYSSGRTEVVRTHYNGSSVTTTQAKQKVKPRFRWGFRGGVNMPLISGLDNGSSNRIGGLLGVSTEIKFINTRNSIIIDAYANQMRARSPSGSDDIEVAYLSFPITYGAAINSWFMFLIGVEPSFTMYSDYRQSGNYYDASIVTNAAAIGVTAGARFFVSPTRVYLDARGVAGASEMFSFGDNSPHKLNLSIGYYIKY